MKIIRAIHWELDSKRKVEHFASMEIAQQHTSEWRVTDWGRITFDEIEVTE